MKPCKTPVAFSLKYDHLQKQRETTQKVKIVISPLRSRLESVIPQVTCICVSLLATGRVLVSLLHPHLMFHFYFLITLTPFIFHFHSLSFFFLMPLQISLTWMSFTCKSVSSHAEVKPRRKKRRCIFSRFSPLEVVLAVLRQVLCLTGGKPD